MLLIGYYGQSGIRSGDLNLVSVSFSQIIYIFETCLCFYLTLNLNCVSYIICQRNVKQRDVGDMYIQRP